MPRPPPSSPPPMPMSIPSRVSVLRQWTTLVDCICRTNRRRWGQLHQGSPISNLFSLSGKTIQVDRSIKLSSSASCPRSRRSTCCTPVLTTDLWNVEVCQRFKKTKKFYFILRKRKGGGGERER